MFQFSFYCLDATQVNKMIIHNGPILGIYLVNNSFYSKRFRTQLYLKKGKSKNMPPQTYQVD